MFPKHQKTVYYNCHILARKLYNIRIYCHKIRIVICKTFVSSHFATVRPVFDNVRVDIFNLLPTLSKASLHKYQADFNLKGYYIKYKNI